PQDDNEKPGFTPGFLLVRADGFRAAALFPCRLAQGLVDAVLPARTALLEMFQHVLVDAQRHLLLDARHRVLRRRRLGDLGGDLLEGGFRLGAGVVQGARASRLVGHVRFLQTARSKDSAPRTTARWPK